MLKTFSLETFHHCKKGILRELFTTEQFSTFQICRSSAKVTLQLMPDIETKLEDAEIKHRRHPGVRKCPHVALPEWLSAAIDKVILPCDQTRVKEDAAKLSQYLYRRRLPIEQEEVNLRTLKILTKMNVNAAEIPVNDAKTEKYMAIVKNKLRCELYRWKPLEYTYRAALAYLISRLPANYACASHVFSEIMSAIPSFQPKTFFDFGSGVGSATWAAHTFWENSLKEYFCVDASAEMNELCERLIRGGEEEEDDDEEVKIIQNIYFRQFLPASNKIKYDLVVSAFSLMDLPSLSDRIRLIDTLWQKTNDVLVIIENGSRAGFTSVLDARDYILEIENKIKDTSTTGSHIVAPCPHEATCPLIGDTKTMPCQFFVTYYPACSKQNSSTLKRDVFSYVVLRRGPQQDLDQWPRIVKPIIRSSKKVYCRLCCNDGKLNELILTKKKHGRHVYRCARQSSQGDQLPVNVVPLLKDEPEDIELDDELKAAKLKSEALEEEEENLHK